MLLLLLLVIVSYNGRMEAGKKALHLNVVGKATIRPCLADTGFRVEL